jgi:pimeloyl-ACP methyl ester carboxylesterase
MFLYPYLFAASLTFGMATAQQASSFNLEPQLAEKYGCGSDCQVVLSQANAMDLQSFGPTFDFDFYATAPTFACSKPGAMLKVEAVYDLDVALPANASVYRIQYTSEDLDGSKVPATGYIILPDVSGPANLVAFAHGTAGVFRGCAPSNSPNLYRGAETWTDLVSAGYAIVATDYVGLGNNHTEHKYVSHAAHANDIIYAVKAARKRFPGRVSKEWVALGHSQGGGAVWKLSEHKLLQGEDSGYLGGVALAPAALKLYNTIRETVDYMRNSSNPDQDAAMLGSAAQLVIGIQNVFPDYDPYWLADGLRQRTEMSHIGQYCVTAMSSLGVGLKLSEILTTFDVSRDTELQEFQNINAPGQRTASTPLFVAHGLADMIAPVTGTLDTFQDSCGQNVGNPVKLKLYPGLDHDTVIAAAAEEWMEFIKLRFAHAPFGKGCSQSMA